MSEWCSKLVVWASALGVSSHFRCLLPRQVFAAPGGQERRRREGVTAIDCNFIFVLVDPIASASSRVLPVQAILSHLSPLAIPSTSISILHPSELGTSASSVPTWKDSLESTKECTQAFTGLAIASSKSCTSLKHCPSVLKRGSVTCALLARSPSRSV
jgi:hypothetical protein